MLAFVRAGFAAALVLALSIPALSADKSFRRDDLADAAIKLEAQIKSEAGSRQQARDGAAARGRRRVSRNDFRTGMQILGQIVAVAPDDSANWLRLARTVLQIAAGQRPRAHRAARTRRDRRLHRLPARQRQRGGGRQPGHHRPQLSRTDRSGGRRSMRCGSRLICARSPTCRRSTRSCARTMASACSTTRSMPMRPRRAPAFSSPRTLPGKRTDFSPFVVDRRAGQACALGRGQAALRRGPQARRTLQRHAARRPSVDRQGDAVEVRRPQRLRARPQAVRALRQQGLCAAAHRPARHPGRQRQHHGGGRRDLSHRRPQPPRHVHRRGLPAQPEPYEVERIASESRRQRLEGRARGRADAQCRSHHRISGRSGGRRSGAGGLRDDRRGRRRARPTDYDSLATQWFIVSDLGLDRLFRQRRRACVRPFAGERQAQGGDVEVRLIVAQQRSAGDASKTDADGYAAFEAGARARGGRHWRLPCWSPPIASGDYAFPQPQGACVRSCRPRRRGPASARRARCVRLHRARRLPFRRDRAGDRAAARRAGRGRARTCRSRLSSSGRTASNTGAASSPIRASADIRCLSRWCPRPRRAPGACAPIPIQSARRWAKRLSWSRTMSLIGLNSTLLPQPRASPGLLRRSSPSKGVIFTAHRRRSSSSKAS